MGSGSRYSEKFKEKVLAKALLPNAPRLVELSRQFNMPHSTLHTWIKMNMHKKMKPLDAQHARRPEEQTPEAKLKMIAETLRLTEAEQGAYCRSHGIYPEHLEEWKQQILAGLRPKAAKENKAEYRQVMVENKKLKSELNRKERALLEASALLLLKKKANLLWGESEDDS